MTSASLRLDYLLECRHFENAIELGEYLIENAKEMDYISKASVNVEVLFCKIMQNDDKSDIRICYENNKKLWEVLESTLSINRIRYAYYSIVENDMEKAIPRTSKQQISSNNCILMGCSIY